MDYKLYFNIIKFFIIIYLLNIIIWYIKNIDYKIKEEYINIINQKKIHFYCKNHLGDSIYNTYYLNFLGPYIEKNNILVYYYCSKEYHKEIKEFITSKNIIILDYQIKGLCLNNLNINFYYNYYGCQVRDRIYNKSKLIHNIHYVNLFNEISKKINFPLEMNNFYFENPRLLTEYNNLDNKYKNLDVFIINSIPRGGQYYTNLDHWNQFIIKLSQEFKIAITRDIDYNIPCTINDKLSVFQIGSISTHSKIIIAINTGPMAACFNNYTINYTKKIYLFDWNVTHSIKNLENKSNINNIDIDEIREIIKLYN
jgi:hypothetical protein